MSDLTAGGGNTSLGRIGVGYLYADWKAQVQYTSPSWSGFSFSVALVDPWGLGGLSGDSLGSGGFSQDADTDGFEGKAGYTWGGDNSTTSGKVWAGFITQALNSSDPGLSNQDATGFDVGAKVGIGGFEVVAYLYDGEGIGTTGFLLDAVNLSGATRDSDGFYLQGTYKFPGVGTKVGVSFGESNLGLATGEAAATSTLVKTNESFVVGVYHPLSASLNLVVEYTDTDATAHNGKRARRRSAAADNVK